MGYFVLIVLAVAALAYIFRKNPTVQADEAEVVNFAKKEVKAVEDKLKPQPMPSVVPKDDPPAPETGA